MLNPKRMEAWKVLILRARMEASPVLDKGAYGAAKRAIAVS